MSLQGPAWPRCVRRLFVGSLLRRPCKTGILISTVLAASPATAKCHLFSVWRFPFPQRCFTALAPEPRMAIHLRPNPPERTVPNQEQIEIPVILLPFEPAPDGDERLRGIALLRDLMSVPPVGQR